ncbi:hypothetical protein GvMRE_IIg490 [endosymbiont GvMRE of Glomus versiforme]|nr:hypothetical protein GvMRE_IIg490 [endosymbiont GvMRE of Glomus versiforme]
MEMKKVKKKSKLNDLAKLNKLLIKKHKTNKRTLHYINQLNPQ